jgi:hypothetical protein
MSVSIHLRFASVLAITLAVPTLASASEFDEKAGVVRFSAGATKTYGFESAADVAAANVSLVRVNSGTGAVTATKVTDGAAVQANLTDAANAVEGAHAFRIGGIPGQPASGLAIMDAEFFATLAGSRVEVSMWARADGATPAVSVQYGKSDWSLEGGFDFASVTSMRTGRETSDGWVEYTTGPIDGSVWGLPIRAILFNAPGGRGGSAAAAGVSYVIDAVEVKKVSGSLTPATACTQDDVETTCGATGDCMYGHCVPSTITWGALPTPEHRAEFAARWSHLGSRLIGDRAASEFGRTVFTPAARDLARYAVSSRQFFGGINKLVNGLRDNHTSFGSPPSGQNLFNPMIQFGWSGALHACFGVVEKDLLGGGIGFGVFHAGDKPITGVILKPGDVLTKIDGKDPKVWADAVIPGIARTSPNDAKSDWANYAESLSIAITTRAKEITITRCASATSCAGADKTELVIPVAAKVFEHLQKGGWGEGIEYFGCSPRFRNSVADFDEASTTEYEDVVTPRTTDGIVNVQFDGFSGTDNWKSKWTSVFEPKPAMVLLDARQGNGGTGDNVEHLLGLMRGRDQRIGFITVVNGTYDEPSPATLFTTYKDCVGGEGGGFSCFGAWGFFSEYEAPSGSTSKVAWINTVDVSANDYMPRLLKGRSKLKIFAPHETSGAFGAVTSFSSFMPGFSGGSIQYQDSRFAATYDDFSAARWESGHGVEPDVVVMQKVSDAIAGKDTMLETARAWLKASE